MTKPWEVDWDNEPAFLDEQVVTERVEGKPWERDWGEYEPSPARLGAPWEQNWEGFEAAPAPPPPDLGILDRWGITEFVDEWDDLAYDTKNSIGSSYRHMGSSALEAIAEAIEFLPFTDPAAASLRETSLEMRDTARYMATQLRRIEDPNMVQQAFLSASTSLSVSMPLMVAAAITKHPGLAAAAFGGTETARSYSESRSTGMEKQQALVHATVSGMIETATEFIPFKRFTDLWDGRVGSSVAGRFAKYMGAELIGENIAETTQRWNDALLGDAENPDWAEIKEIMALTTLSTFMAAGAQGAVATGANKLKEHIARSREALQDPEVRESVQKAVDAWSEIDRKREEGIIDEAEYQEEYAKVMESVEALAENESVQEASGVKQDIETVVAEMEGKGILPEDFVGLLSEMDSQRTAQAIMPIWTEIKNQVKKSPHYMDMYALTPERIKAIDERLAQAEHGKGLPQPEDQQQEPIEGEIVEQADIDDMVGSVEETMGEAKSQNQDIQTVAATDNMTETVKQFLKKDLVAMAQALGISYSGNKRDIGLRIQQYVRDNETVSDEAREGPVLEVFTDERKIDPVTQKWKRYPGVPLQIYKNPTISQLRRAMARSGSGKTGLVVARQTLQARTSKALRFIRDTRGNWYFWDASTAIHDQVLGRIRDEEGEAFAVHTDDRHNASENYIDPGDLGETGPAQPGLYQKTQTWPHAKDGYVPPEYRALAPQIRYPQYIERMVIKEDDTEPAAHDWMPFTADFEMIEHSNGETHRMNGAQRRVVARILERLPVNVVNMVSFVGVLKNSDRDIPGDYTGANRIIRVAERALASVRTWMHEFGHAVDFWEGGDFALSEQSPLYSINWKDGDYGKVMAEALKAYNVGQLLIKQVMKETGAKGYDPTGKAAGYLTEKQIRAHAQKYYGPEKQAFIETMFVMTYPFDQFVASKHHYRAGDIESTQEQDGYRNAQFFQTELFAQQYMMYYEMSDIMRVTMPEAFTIMRNIRESADRSQSISEFNTRVRKAIQAPGSGLGAAGLSELSREAGTSLGIQRTDKRVLGPPIQSPPYRRNTTVASRPNRREFKPGRIIYDWMANQFGYRFTLLKKMQDQFEYRVARRRAQAAIKRADRLVRRIGDMFEGLDAETQEAVYQYLTTRDASPTDFIDADIMVRDRGSDPSAIVPYRMTKGKMVPLHKKAQSVKRLIRQLGLQLVHHGLLEREVYEEHKDQYLPQMYLRHILNDDSVRMLASRGKMDLKWAIRRNENLTELFKKAFLGQVFDPAYLVPMTIGKVSRDLAILEFLNEISGNENWVEPATLVEWTTGDKHATDDPQGRWAAGDPMYLSVTPQWLLAEADRIDSQLQLMKDPEQRNLATFMVAGMRKQAQEARDRAGLRKDFNIKDYIQIPDNPVYGPLRGAWVRKEISDDLRGALEISMEGEKTLAERAIGLDSLQAAHSMFKLNKVALNPPTVFRNMWSNMILLQLSGVPFHRFPKLMRRVVRDFKNKGEIYRVAVQGGLDASTFTSAELAELNRNLDRIYEKTTGRAGVTQVVEASRVVSKWLHEIGGGIFQFTEMFGKMIKIADELDRGSSPEVAVDEANKALFDYSEVPRTVEFLRKYPFGAPFATFYYKVVPRVIEAALATPWRFLPYISLYYGLQLAASWRLDIDDDDWASIKKQLPEYVRDGTALLPWPFRDAQGNVQFLDMSYIFPWTMPLELVKSTATGRLGEAMESTGLMGGPIPWVWQSLEKNLHPFYETPIYNENDPAAHQFADALTFIWNQFSPGLLTAEPGNFVYKLLHAYVGETDMYGNPPPTPAQAWTRAAGWNFYAPNRARNLYFMQRAIEDEIAAMKSAIRKAKWPGEKERIERRYRANIERMMRDLEEYKRASELMDQATEE